VASPFEPFFLAGSWIHQPFFAAEYRYFPPIFVPFYGEEVASNADIANDAASAT
jgi:hypothetical protein